jgi:hypothetical protein
MTSLHCAAGRSPDASVRCQQVAVVNSSCTKDLLRVTVAVAFNARGTRHMLPTTALPASLRRRRGTRRCWFAAALSPCVTAAALPVLVTHSLHGRCTGRSLDKPACCQHVGRCVRCSRCLLGDTVAVGLHAVYAAYDYIACVTAQGQGLPAVHFRRRPLAACCSRHTARTCGPLHGRCTACDGCSRCTAQSPVKTGGRNRA